MSDTDPGVQSDLIDLSELTLARVRTLDHPVLSGCLERILRDSDSSGDVVAGFNSSL